MKESSSEKFINKMNESDLFLDALLASIPFNMDIVDREGNLLFASKGFLSVIGNKGFEKKCWEIYKDDGKQCENCPLKNVSNLKEPEAIEVDGLLGGKTFLIHHAIMAFGGQKFILEIFQDITERKKDEQRIKIYSENLEKITDDLKKFQLAVANASDHMVITNPEGYVLYANQAVEKITGYPLKEVIGAKTSLWGKQMNGEFYERFWRTIKEEKRPFVGEITNRRKDGERYIAEIKVSPILNESKDVEFFVGIERDITKSKELEKTKNEFISLTSHQLRTPLTSINLAAEMLLLGLAGETNYQQKRYLKDIMNGVKGMTELIELLLNISRIELGTFMVNLANVPIPPIIEKILKEVTPHIKKKNIKLKKNFDKFTPAVKIDPGLAQIILQNIISNAVKYTGQNGKIFISVKKQGEEIVIAVADTGCGIPEDQQKMIFTKMFRARNAVNAKTEGTGFGLYAIKAMADECGATIRFESKESKGTTFYFAIPVSGMKKMKRRD